MTWKDTFKIGIPEIDRQHKQLCDQIDSLFAACAQGKGTEEALKTLTFLETYALRHFADEELQQQKLKYPKYQQHKALHSEFVGKLTKMKKDMLANGATLATVIQINQVISDWLVNHILKVDAELRDFVS